MLAATARAAGTPLPVMIMHDVLLALRPARPLLRPRADPGGVPPAVRTSGACGRARPKLLPTRRAQPDACTTPIAEGGPRNGVMTALDDFVAEHDRPLRRVVLPIYFGLAIVVEEERLERAARAGGARSTGSSADGSPARAAASWRRRSACEAMVFQHNVSLRSRAERSTRHAARYLDAAQGRAARRALPRERGAPRVPRSAARERGTAPDSDRSATRCALDARARLRRPGGRAARRAIAGDGNGAYPYFPYTSDGPRRLDHLDACLDAVRDEPGRRRPRRVRHRARRRRHLHARLPRARDECPTATVWVGGPFRATPADAAAESRRRAAGRRRRRLRGRPQPGARRLRPLRPARRPRALPPGSARGHARRRADRRGRAAAHRRRPSRAAPRACSTRSTTGSRSAASWSSRPRRGRQAAIEAFRARAGHRRAARARRRGHASPGARAQSASRWRRRPRHTAGATAAPRAARPARARATGAHGDLSVVVVFYNMRREAERTLHSLSRAYQEGIDDLDYEVIVVENGSAPTRSSARTFVRSFGPEFRYLDLGAEATPSPVARAQPRHRRRARRDARADDRRRPRPHAGRAPLRHGRPARPTRPAIVATQQWYVGPGQQGEHVHERLRPGLRGPALHSASSWPSRRLPAVRDRPLHRRPRLVRRHLGEQLPVRAARAARAGRRLRRELLDAAAAATRTSSSTSGSARPPTSRSATILGEGSFHQLHGGTTTNRRTPTSAASCSPATASTTRSCAARTGPGHPICSTSSATCPATPLAPARAGAWRRPRCCGRSCPRPRRVPRRAGADPRRRQARGDRGVLAQPRLAGHALARPHCAESPADLMAYQELIVRLRPDWIVETRDRRRRRWLRSSRRSAISRAMARSSRWATTIRPPTRSRARA